MSEDTEKSGCALVVLLFPPTLAVATRKSIQANAEELVGRKYKGYRVYDVDAKNGLENIFEAIATGKYTTLVPVGSDNSEELNQIIEASMLRKMDIDDDFFDPEIPIL